MNSRGRSFGLALVLILIVALFVAWLAMKNFTSLNQTVNPVTQQTQAPVEQARDAVNAINAQQQKALDALESFG